MSTKKTPRKVAAKKPSAVAVKKAVAAREARNTALKVAADVRMPLVQDDAEVPRQRRSRRPPPPNPTVLALQAQIVPLVDQREEAMRQVAIAENQLAQVHHHLENMRKQLQNTEAAINYRLQLVSQIEGRPAELVIRQEHAPVDLSGILSTFPENPATYPILTPTSLAGVSSIPSGRPPQLGVQPVGGDPRYADIRSESAEAERRAM